VLGLLLVAVVDEHDVDVARVVQLSATELAHADDREPRGRRGDVHRDSEASPRERRELGDNVANRRSEQIDPRYARSAAASTAATRARISLGTRCELR
jgi:hypothetical protein